MTKNHWLIFCVVSVYVAVVAIALSVNDAPPPTICEIEHRGHAVYCDGALCGCTSDPSNMRV